MNTLARLCLTIGVLAGSIGLSRPVFADEAPDVLIKRVSQEVMEIARNDKEIQGRNMKRIAVLVETKILPHLDMQRATALTAGRHWRDATPEQQKQLTEQFRNLLLYTYAGAMSQIKDQKLEFKPLRADPGDTEVVVRSQVKLPRRPEPVQVSYRLAKTQGGWKIYDVNVLGVWLSETYRSSFSSEINRSGIDGLINALTEKNRKLASASDPPRFSDQINTIQPYAS